MSDCMEIRVSSWDLRCPWMLDSVYWQLLTAISGQSHLNESGSPRTLPVKPSQAQVLTGGGDLREAQVDVPLSVSYSCV